MGCGQTAPFTKLNARHITSSKALAAHKGMKRIFAINCLGLAPLILLMLFTGSCATTENETKTVQPADGSLLVTVKSVRSLGPGKPLKWNLVVQNTNNSTLLVSMFSLENVISSVKLKDASNREWRVLPPTGYVDPPPPDVDYSLRVSSKGSAQIYLQSDNVEMVVSDDAHPETAITRPFEYEIKREASVIDTKSGKASWINCHGSGRLQIEQVRAN